MGEHILDGYSRTTQSKMECAALIINRAENSLRAETSHETPDYRIVTHTHTQQMIKLLA